MVYIKTSSSNEVNMNYGYAALLVFGAIVITAYICLVNKICKEDLESKYTNSRDNVNVR